MFQLTLWSIPPLLAAIVTAVLYRRIKRNNHVPGVHGLLLLMSCIGFWAVAQIAYTLLALPAHQILVQQISLIGAVLTPVAWMSFAISYARRQMRAPPIILNTLSVVPFATILLGFTNPAHGWIWQDISPFIESGYAGLILSYGPWFYAQALYSFVLMIAGSAVLAYILSVSQSNWRPVAAIIAAPTVATAAMLYHVSPLNLLPLLDLRALGIAVAAWILYRGVLRYGLLDNIPVVRDRVVNQLSDPVVVVNHKGLIVDANEAAVSMFAQERPELLMSSIAQFIPRWPTDDLRSDGAALDEITISGQIYDVAFSVLDTFARHSDVVLVFRDVTVRREGERRLRRMQKELERLAHTDALTGLFNRRIFMQRLEEEVERVRRHGSAVSVVLFDLDYFKRVNDTYGHDTGDVVLASVARIATDVKRMSDVAARLGGEEFALLLPETDQQGAVQLAQRLRTAIERHQYLSPAGAPLHVTASIGVATAQRSAKDVEKLLSSADRALYRAKNNGRNRVCSTTL